MTKIDLNLYSIMEDSQINVSTRNTPWTFGGGFAMNVSFVIKKHGSLKIQSFQEPVYFDTVI